MGRPPSNGGPAFRFNPSEVAEMEAILQAHNAQVPAREILVSLAEKFSNSTDRSGKVAVQMKQVWNWFQNRRYALRAKAAKAPAKLSASPAIANDLAAVRNVPQAPQHMPVAPISAIVRNASQVPQAISSTSVQSSGQNGSDNFMMEFEAKSARDGAWYDVATFISHRSVETSDPEVLVRFAGLGPEEDEWVNVRKHVRQRSLPCEATECVVVNQSDLILCFQEGKEQALYFDAHVLDAQRRRHDVRGCRCRFLVRYDHDLSEEIVPLKKVCRRPETDYRLRQLHAESANMNQSKTVPMPHTGNVVIYPSSEATQKQQKAEAPGETKEELPKVDMLANIRPVQAPVTQTNASTTTASLADAVTGVNAAVVAPALAVQPITPVAMTPPISVSNVSGVTLSLASTTNSAVQPTDSGATISRVISTVTVADPITSGATFSAASTTNPADQFIGSGTTASSVTATPVTHLVTPGTTASTFQDANSHISGSAASALTTTSVSNLSVAGAMATTAPVANLTTITTPVANSTFAEAVTTTTPHPNSIVTGAVTTTIPVANSTGAAASDSLVTITTPSLNSNLAGVTDSMVTTTASTANSDVSGVTESVGIASDGSGVTESVGIASDVSEVTESIGIATTPVVAESSVPEVPNSVASEEV